MTKDNLYLEQFKKLNRFCSPGKWDTFQKKKRLGGGKEKHFGVL